MACFFRQLSLCGKDSLKWANVAIKVSLEAHNLLHDAWPDETVGQVKHRLLVEMVGCALSPDSDYRVHFFFFFFFGNDDKEHMKKQKTTYTSQRQNEKHTRIRTRISSEIDVRITV